MMVPMDVCARKGRATGKGKHKDNKEGTGDHGSKHKYKKCFYWTTPRQS